MTRSEIARLLALAAARDRRTVGDADTLAWITDLAGITYDEAVEALNRHFRESTEWLTPARIRAYVKVIRAEQRKGTSAPLALPSRWEPDEERAERARRGAAKCREALAHLMRRRPDPDEQPDPIRARALERARQERSERRRNDPAPVGDLLRDLRHRKDPRP